MIGKYAIVALACIALSSPAFAQGGGGGAGAGGGAGGSAGSAASSSVGTGTSSTTVNSGASAASGMGTRDTTIGASHSNASQNNPNVQPPTPNGRSPAAAQAERNTGVGHAANGLPIGSPGTGTSNEDQR
jgi:hypothetical protein